MARSVLIAAIFAAGLLCGWVGNGWRLGAEIADLEADHAEQIARAHARTREAEASARAKEQAMQRKVNDANTALEAERQKHRRVSDGLRSDVGVMRDAIRAFVGSGGHPEESCAAERERAATLGALLDDAVRTAETLAGAAERHAGEVRALLNAWPVDE